MATETIHQPLATRVNVRRHPYLRHVGLALLLAYFLLATFPGSYVPVQPGLDPSWNYAISYLAHSSEYLFGRDVFFTFGPLGYLYSAAHVGPSVAYAGLVRAIIHALWGGLLAYYLWRRKRVWAVLAFMLTYLIAHALGFRDEAGAYDFYLVLLLCSLVGLAFGDPRARRIAFLLSGLLAGGQLFIKFSSGVAAFLILAAAGVLLWLATRDWKAVLAGWGAYLAAVGVLTVTLLGSAGVLDNWLKASFEIASGYSAAMSIVGPANILWAALAALAIYALLLAGLWAMKLPLRYLALVCAIPCFTVFKGGFVRQDAHVFAFFLFAPALLSILILNTERRRELVMCAVAFILLLACARPAFKAYNPDGLKLTKLAGTFLLEPGRARFNDLVYRQQLEARLAEHWRVTQGNSKLPDRMLGAINREKARVDVIPWELSYVPANNLHWRPMPTLQAYVAYTAYLDQLNAGHYAQAPAPDFVIIEYMSVDNRHPVLDTPATWRALLSNYELAESSSARLLLKKNPTFTKSDLREVGRQAITLEQWIAVPPSEVPLYAELQMPLTLRGKITKTFYMIPPVHIDLQFESGRAVTHRLIPEVASNGMLMNYLPLNLRDLGRLFACQSGDRVRQFRLSGPGAAYYQSALEVVWRSAPTPCAAIKLPEEDLALVPKGQLASTSRWGIDPRKLEPSAETTQFSLDQINGRTALHLNPLVTIDTSQERRIALSGWAVDTAAGRAAAGVFVSLDGRDGEVDIPVDYGQDRADVAQVFSQPGYRLSGFSLAIPTASLKPGTYTLTLKVVRQDHKHYAKPQYPVTLEIK